MDLLAVTVLLEWKFLFWIGLPDRIKLALTGIVGWTLLSLIELLGWTELVLMGALEQIC